MKLKHTLLAAALLGANAFFFAAPASAADNCKAEITGNDLLPAMVVRNYASERDRFTRALATNRLPRAATRASTEKMETPHNQ